MLNTQKLLYVLPDLAYIAELLPDKKPYTYAIQSFKQVNGEFLNETQFIPENIVKLVNKLEEGEEYFLVLPDFLFTNTIVSVKETTDAKIKEGLENDILPKLNLKDDSHLIETVVLNQLKGTTRVQISAIEKSVLSIFKVAIADKDIKIAGVAPLSWVVKSLISLEPSISVLQMGSNLYTAQQYIGVDQATSASVESPENIIETIKTLKGAESSIQTVYLCTNAIVEDKLKDELNKILPLQQMATKDGDSKIPSYVSEIITSSMRTLNVPDFSVPTFKLTKATAEEKAQFATLLTASGTTTEEENDTTEAELPKPNTVPGTEAEKTDENQETESSEDQASATIEEPPHIEDIKEAEPATNDLPEIESADKSEDTENSTVGDITSGVAGTATAVAAGAAASTAAVSAATPAVVTTPTESSNVSEVSAEAETKTSVTDTVPEINTTIESGVETTSENSKKEIKEESPQSPDEEVTTTETKSDNEIPPVVVGAAQVSAPNSTTETAENKEGEQDIDLSQFTQQTTATTKEPETEIQPVEKKVIKNKSGVKNMMKMVLITTGVFILTVAIGIGVGLAILKYSGSDNGTGTPSVEVQEPSATPETTPEPTPTPAASTSAEINKDEFNILVVNATTKAGYAGQIGNKLEAADFTEITTGNAKGEYEEGNYVYLKESSKSVFDELVDASELSLKEDESAKVEDAQGRYDAIIVLAE